LLYWSYPLLGELPRDRKFDTGIRAKTKDQTHADLTPY
jgi:hypothetical protein